MKIPGPGHPIAITPNPNRIRVVFAGRVVAETAKRQPAEGAACGAVPIAMPEARRWREGGPADGGSALNV